METVTGYSAEDREQAATHVRDNAQRQADMFARSVRHRQDAGKPTGYERAMVMMWQIVAQTMQEQVKLAVQAVSATKP